MIFHKYLIFTALCLGTSNIFAQTCNNTSTPESSPTSQFTDQEDGTTLDNVTGLTWKVCSEGQTWDSSGTCTGTVSTYNWQEALNWAETVNNSGGFANQTNWRVPNIKEYRSIVDEQCVFPSINEEVFPNTLSDYYWTSSTYDPLPTAQPFNAWRFSFQWGINRRYYKSGEFAIRLVRD